VSSWRQTTKGKKKNLISFLSSFSLLLLVVVVVVVMEVVMEGRSYLSEILPGGSTIDVHRKKGK